MQYNGSCVGNVGPFTDPATGQPVSGTVSARFVVQSAQPLDYASVAESVNGAILYALHTIIGQKLAAGQAALPTLQASLPYWMAEIGQISAIGNIGLELVQISPLVNIASPVPVVAPPQGPLPPDPMQATRNAFKHAAAERLDPRNYEVKATVNVGGFKVKASSEKGIDTEGLKKQAVDKAKSTILWWIGGCVILAFVGVFLLGLAGYIGYVVWSSSSGSAPSGKAEAASWDGKTPFVCGGNDNVVIEDVKATLTEGPAVSAGANCQLLLDGVTISAPIAILAAGNARVTVKGGSVTGTQYAAQALALGQITFEGTKVVGEKQALGNAKITGP